MTENASPLTKNQAITKAWEYLEGTLNLNRDVYEVHEVWYRRAEVDHGAVEQVLGRSWSNDLLPIFKRFNKSGWIVQFVFESCEPGATPQGPSVLINDDGDIWHYRPM